MGRADIITKEYIGKPDIFADVFNQYLYGGRQIIRPEQVSELDGNET